MPSATNEYGVPSASVLLTPAWGGLQVPYDFTSWSGISSGVTVMIWYEVEDNVPVEWRLGSGQVVTSNTGMVVVEDPSMSVVTAYPSTLMVLARVSDGLKQIRLLMTKVWARFTAISQDGGGFGMWRQDGFEPAILSSRFLFHGVRSGYPFLMLSHCVAQTAAATRSVVDTLLRVPDSSWEPVVKYAVQNMRRAALWVYCNTVVKI